MKTLKLLRVSPLYKLKPKRCGQCLGTGDKDDYDCLLCEYVTSKCRFCNGTGIARRSQLIMCSECGYFRGLRFHCPKCDDYRDLEGKL